MSKINKVKDVYFVVKYVAFFGNFLKYSHGVNICMNERKDSNGVKLFILIAWNCKQWWEENYKLCCILFH